MSLKPSGLVNTNEITGFRAEGVDDRRAFSEFETLRLAQNRALQWKEKLLRSPRHAQRKQHFQSSALYMQEVHNIQSAQHAQGLQLVLPSQLAQGLQPALPPQHAQGLQLVWPPEHAQEKKHFHSSVHTQEVQLIRSPQHAQGLQLVWPPEHTQEKKHFHSSVHTQVQLIRSPQHAQEKQLFHSSVHTQEVQLIRSPQHAQEKQLFHSSAHGQKVQLIPSHQHAQGLQLIVPPRHAQGGQLFRSSAYMQEGQLNPSPEHTQGLKLVESPRYAQEKQLFYSSDYMQEVELIPSSQHAQGLQLVYSPASAQKKQLAQIQTTQPLESPTQVQEITKYLLAHDLWQVPDSVLYEEPTLETECDLETCLGQINDATDAAENKQEIDMLNAEDSVKAKGHIRVGRRHKGNFMKRPMALSHVIEELQNNDLRENALRCLSGHLVERREQDPDFYRQAGFLIFHSCSTLVILIQEILCVYDRSYANDLNIRRSKRMGNVLCLLQCIATNHETRLPFVKARIPNYLIPFILSEYTEEVYENLRALSLSVISILCQAREKEIMQWVLQNDIIEVCFHALDIGSELSKVLAMTVLDAILRVDEGLSAICEPSCDLLPRFIKLCEDLLSVLAYIRGFSPRLLFLVVRTFILLCQNCRALELLKDQLPTQLQDKTFRDVKMEYPLFAHLRHLLLLCTGKANDYLPSVDRSPTTPVRSGSPSKNREDSNSSGSGKARNESVRFYVTRMRPVDLNKQDWSSSPRQT